MRLVVGCRNELLGGLYDELIRYRYNVFVHQLSWRLPHARPGHEEDEFDNDATVYLVALKSDDQICGCGRLLSTESPYLLGTVFPHLVDGALPRSPAEWELSRFCATPGLREQTAHADGLQRLIFQRALYEAHLRGAERVVGVLSCAVERTCRAFGANLQRLGPPQQHQGQRIVACATSATLPLRTPLQVGRPRPHTAQGSPERSYGTLQAGDSRAACLRRC